MLAGWSAFPEVLAQLGTCSGPVVERISMGEIVDLDPGTYRPVIGGVSIVGVPGGTGSSSVSLQVLHAATGAFYAQYLRSWSGGLLQESPFPYITLLEPTSVRIRARAAVSCGTARISGIVYFEKVG
jgi:hypothetical protein